MRACVLDVPDHHDPTEWLIKCLYRERPENGIGYITKNGAIYRGEFVQWRPWGRGRLEWKDGKKTHEGQFAGGKPNGRGTRITPTSNIPNSDFVDGKRCELYTTQAIYGKRRNDTKFSGEVVARYAGTIWGGVRHGFGELTTDKYTYKGMFKRGKIHGYGKYKSLVQDMRYKGLFKQEIKCGYGVTSREDSEYCGIHKFGMFHGFGVQLTRVDCFVGEFRMGRRCGPGVLSLRGVTLDVIYEDGRLLPEYEYAVKDVCKKIGGTSCG
jgi:hypothetical protein